MIDTYVQAPDAEALQNFCAPFGHVIGPVQGTAETTDENGNPVPAKGDASTWYACIRSPTEPTPEAPISLTPTEIGQTVVGVWS